MSRCVACGRRLSRPSPWGLGPVCARRLGVAAARASPPRPATGPAPHVPGQTELPLSVTDPAA